MKTSQGGIMRSLIVIAVLALTSLSAYAQADYPSKPIRFVLVSSAGSGGDVLARLLAKKMSSLINGTFVIENKPGASGILATDSVAKAPPDGYTILLGSYTGNVLLPSINPKLPYDSVNDFAPLGQIGTAPILLVVANEVPANNLQELVSLSHKAGLQYGTWGIGSTGHFCAELLKQRTSADMDHIPYKSSSQLANDIMGGHIKIAFFDMATGSPLVKSGGAKAIASCTTRSPSLPGVASYEDEGIHLPGRHISPPRWVAYAPVRTPKPIVAKLSAALKAAVEMPDVAARLLDMGVTPAFVDGDEVRKMNQDDIDAWKDIAKASNITIE
jgi:tripartite-type tricarboxylate transporter receptor subunit TctC